MLALNHPSVVLYKSIVHPRLKSIFRQPIPMQVSRLAGPSALIDVCSCVLQASERRRSASARGGVEEHHPGEAAVRAARDVQGGPARDVQGVPSALCSPLAFAIRAHVKMLTQLTFTEQHGHSLFAVVANHSQSLSRTISFPR